MSKFKFGSTMIIVGICLIVLFVPRTKKSSEHGAEAPHWNETNFLTTERSEIEELCGDDLLLENLPVFDEYQEQYILSIVEKGDFSNQEDWKTLQAEVHYGDSIYDAGVDNVYCWISFDGSTAGFDTDWLADIAATTVEEINGYTVYQRKISKTEAAEKGVNLGSNAEYRGYAHFIHHGYHYYFTTGSDSSDFFDLVLEKMLN